MAADKEMGAETYEKVLDLCGKKRDNRHILFEKNIIRKLHFKERIKRDESRAIQSEKGIRPGCLLPADRRCFEGKAEHKADIAAEIGAENNGRRGSAEYGGENGMGSFH